jgi:hypothetical protein
MNPIASSRLRHKLARRIGLGLRAAAARGEHPQGAAPAGSSLAAVFLDNSARQLRLAGVELRLGTTGSVEAVLALAPDAVVVATGARPYRDDALTFVGAVPTGSWDVLAGRLPEGDSVLVADWGADPSGLDAAEVLAAAGRRVTLAVASLAPAEPSTSTGGTSTCSGSTARA